MTGTWIWTLICGQISSNPNLVPSCHCAGHLPSASGQHWIGESSSRELASTGKSQAFLALKKPVLD